MCRNYSAGAETVCCDGYTAPPNSFTFSPECTVITYLDPSIYVSSICITFEIIIAVVLYIALLMKRRPKGSTQEVAPLRDEKSFLKKKDVSVKRRPTKWLDAAPMAILIVCTIADELMVILSFRYLIAAQITICFWFAAALLSAGGVMLGPSLRQVAASVFALASLIVLLLQVVPIPSVERDVAVFTLIGLSVLVNHSTLAKWGAGKKEDFEYTLFITELVVTSFVIVNVFYSFLGGWYTREAAFSVTKLIYLASLSTLVFPEEIGSGRRDAY